VNPEFPGACDAPEVEDNGAYHLVVNCLSNHSNSVDFLNPIDS
jgi:hypothetical protein